MGRCLVGPTRRRSRTDLFFAEMLNFQRLAELPRVSMKSWLLVLLALLPGMDCVGDPAFPLYHPKLENSKKGDHHDFPLGVISATGRLIDGESEILIVDLGKGGPADKAGLQVGDRIISPQEGPSARFSKATEAGLAGPQTELARAYDAAQATAPPDLDVEVQRGGKRLALKVRLPGGRLDPAKLLKGIAAHLLATQQKNGRWQPGVGGDADVYTSAFCGLALLAADEVQFLPAVKAAIRFINEKSTASIDPKNPRVGPKNWQAASSAILMAEYQLATGDASFFKSLQANCDLLAARVTPQGKMGHHFDIPYNGGGLVIINSQAHLAWALAEKCGHVRDEVAWSRSYREVEASLDQRTGALGYSAKAPRSPDIAARTGAMASALAITGAKEGMVLRLAGALAAHHGRMRHAHAMSSIGLIFGFAGLKSVDPKAHREVMEKWRPFLELSRNASGSAAYFGGKRNIGGDQYLGLSPIGNAMTALMIASAEGKLHMHGGRQKHWIEMSR